MGYNSLIAGYNSLIAGYNLLIVGYNLLIVGYNLLIAGYNSLIVGYNLLIGGYNLLIAGYILLMGCYNLSDELIKCPNDGSNYINMNSDTLKRLTHVLLFTIFLFAASHVDAQENVVYEFTVPTINQWQFKPITSYPCLILKAEEKEKLKSNYGQLPESEKKLDLPVKVWITDGDNDEKQKATQYFIKYWKDYNKKWNVQNLQRDEPDGVAMRGIWRSIDLYDVVQSFGLLAEKDRIEYRDSLVKSIELALGKDYKNPKVTPHIGFHHMNIWTDVVVAAGATGLAFPELPQSKDWVEFAMNEINWQLTTGVWEDCWHESARYHMAVLTSCGQLFEMLLNRTGIDMFQHPSIKRMCGWAVTYSTPLTTVPNLKNPKPNGISLMPAIGDASWAPEAYGMLNFYARHFVQTDPQLSAQLQWQWQRSGSTIEGCTGEMALLVDPTLKAQSPKTLTSAASKRKGYVLMRDKFNTPDEVWFLQKSGEPSYSGHENADRNSFSLFAYGYPLALDAGSGNYNDPRHAAWHKRTVAHNAVVFEDNKYLGDIPKAKSQKIVAGKVLAWKTTDEADYSSTDASAASGVERNIRSVVFVKPDYFVIKDEIKSSQNSYWLLHTTAKDFIFNQHSVSCETPWGVNLDLFMVSPDRAIDTTIREGAIGDWLDDKTVAIEQRTGQRIKPKGPEADFFPFRYQKYLAIPGKPNEDFLMLLQPHRKSNKPLTFKRINENKIEVICHGRKDIIEFTETGVKLTKGDKEIVF